MNNATTIPIEKFTVAEKLLLMERLWEDLSKQPSNVAPPEWHGDVLAARLAAVKEGRTGLSIGMLPRSALGIDSNENIRLLPEAERDLEIGADFYESQRQVLALISMTA